MPSFKPKTCKKIKYNKKSSVTLDTKHKEYLNEFNKNEHNLIPNLKLERTNLLKKIQDNIDFEERLDIQDRIKEINEQIKESKCKKKEYFLDNSKYIFEYFENKKNISTGTKNDNLTTNKSTLINTFFKIKENNDTNNNINEHIQKQNSNIVL